MLSAVAESEGLVLENVMSATVTVDALGHFSNPSPKLGSRTATIPGRNPRISAVLRPIACTPQGSDDCPCQFATHAFNVTVHDFDSLQKLADPAWFPAVATAEQSRRSRRNIEDSDTEDSSDSDTEDSTTPPVDIANLSRTFPFKLARMLLGSVTPLASPYLLRCSSSGIESAQLLETTRAAHVTLTMLHLLPLHSFRSS